MGATRRKFTLEFRTEAAHRVIDTGRTVRDVAKELSVLENSLGVWVREERRRIESLEVSSDVPLTAAERAELLRLRRQVAEQEKDLAFLGLCGNPDYVETITRALCLTQIEQKFSA
jgi:transposase-like protein